MKKTMKTVVLAVAMMAASICSAFSLPLVGTGTEPNQWTRNISGVLSAAQTTGYPILLVMINDSSTGEGCSHCKLFVERTLNTADFTAIVNDYKFYMVLLNYWGVESGVSQPEYGGVSGSLFITYFYKYASDNGYPVVAVIRPNGQKYNGWGDSTVPSTRGMTMYQHIRQAIDDLSIKDTIFELSPQSGTVTIPAGASQPGVWSGVVTRSGGSQKTGTVSLSVSGDNASRYWVEPSSQFDWDANDGSINFTVKGPSQPDGGIIADTLTIDLTASGFSGSTLSYGNTQAVVTFKDERVSKTLKEFAAEPNGFDILESTGTWYVPSDGSGALLCSSVSWNETSSFVWTATKGGVATLSAKVEGTVTVQINNASPVSLSVDPLTVGVGVGDRVTITANGLAGAVTAVGEVGLATLSFEELRVTLEQPTDGMLFSWPMVCADASLVNLAWSATLSPTSYVLFGGNLGNSTVDVGSATAVNAIDIGLVVTDRVMGDVVWGVSAIKDDVDYGKAVAQTTALFTISAKPEYHDMPANVSAYLKAGASLDFHAWSPEGTGEIIYSASGLPKGLGINSAGVITGTPKKSGTYSVTVTASNDYGSESTTFTLKVSKFPKSWTGNYNGVLFDADQRMVASATWKVTAGGQWSAKVMKNNKKTSVRGKVLVNADNSISLNASGFFAKNVGGASLWTGSWNGALLLGKKTPKLGNPWVGTWNCAFGSSASPGRGGYACITVKKTGKATFSGKVSGKEKLSGDGIALILDAGEAETYLRERWAGHGTAAFFQGCKKKFNGGFVLFGDGTAKGDVMFGGLYYDTTTGAKWSSKQSFASLSNAMFEAGELTFPLKVTAKKVGAGDNAVSADVKVMQKSGVVKGSFKNGGSAKFEGVLYSSDGVLKGFGGGIVGAEHFSFTIQ